MVSATANKTIRRAFLALGIILLAVVCLAFFFIYSVFPTVTLITKHSPDQKHVAQLSRVYGFDAIVKLSVDGRSVYRSPDFAPAQADFREQVIWDQRSQFLVLEVAGQRLFGYHVAERRPLNESEMASFELTPIEDLGYEGTLPDSR